LQPSALSAYIAPGDPSVILRIGTEQDNFNMTARAVAVYETMSGAAALDMVQGVTPVRQYTELNSVRDSLIDARIMIARLHD
jgi:hypothetical protein